MTDDMCELVSMYAFLNENERSGGCICCPGTVQQSYTDSVPYVSSTRALLHFDIPFGIFTLFARNVNPLYKDFIL
jgi:hypothetical protein